MVTQEDDKLLFRQTFLRKGWTGFLRRVTENFLKGLVDLLLTFGASESGSQAFGRDNLRRFRDSKRASRDYFKLLDETGLKTGFLRFLMQIVFDGMKAS